MSHEMIALLTAAASVGFFHTILGPDHYIPFIAMSRSGKWSVRKTVLVTLLCGIGHVLGSVALGILGVTLGIGVSRIESLESVRGDLALWVLISFGLVYFAWGVRKAIKNRPHRHHHSHGESLDHDHSHLHNEEHVHVHDLKETANVTPWALFVVFVLGPCEPLIPMLMYPAAKNSFSGLVMVTGVFAGITILTMIGIVLISCHGFSVIPSGKMERYTHAIAGAIISLTGIAVLVFGL
jgi:ABC-type nickel/cobalt efflux system permease component RcnA